MQRLKQLRLIMVACLILSMCSSLYSQVIDSKQYNYIGNWYRWQGGGFITNLNIPKVTATTGRDTGGIRYSLADSSVYVWTGSQWRQIGSGGSGSVAWGGITGTLSNQTDLQNALNLKLNITTAAATYVPYTGATGSVNLGAFGLTTDRLVFNQAPTLAGGVGIVRWNDTDGTIEFGMKGGNVTQQVGQELPVRMRNNTGSTILNGEAVYISGSTGSSTIIAKAKADASSTSKATIGLLTEDIANGQSGFVTVFGKVRDINTSALTEGGLVYLSSTVAGGLTSTPPTGDTYPVVIGVCERSHAVNGVIFVHIDKEYVRAYELDTAKANIRTQISGESVAWGTYAQRIAIASPITGQRFYQTNERIGEWVYGNGQWEQGARNTFFKFAPNNTTSSYLTTGVSGAGASFQKLEVHSAVDSIYGPTFLASTGTTSTGSAYVAGVNNYAFAPSHFAVDTNFVNVMHWRIKIDQAPTAAQDFRLFFGGSNYGSGPLNDSSDSRFFFRLAFYRNSTSITGYYKNTNSSETNTATLTTFASLINNWNDYVIVYNDYHVEFWINGTRYYQATLVDPSTSLGFCTPLIGIQKVSGTTAATIKLSELHVYRAKKRSE